MKVSDTLKNILNEHKILYTVGLILIAIGTVIYPFVPYIRFLLFFSVFCGICCIIYGLLLHFKKSTCKTVSLLSKILQICALTLIGIFIISFIAIQCLIVSSMSDSDSECGYLLVLGGGVNGTEPSLSLLYRLYSAEEYLNKHPESKAILCGGQGPGEYISEAEAMYRYLKNHGIDEERLIKEDKSHDTRENIANARKIIADSTNANLPVAVVSSDFHLYRVKIIMRKQGFDKIHTICAKTPAIPALVANLHLREYFSVILEYMNI